MAASLNVGEVTCVAGRDEDYEWEAYAKDGRTAVAFGVSDRVLFKLGSTEDDATPIINIDSEDLSGSLVMIDDLGSAGVTPASGRVRLARADTASLTGELPFEVILIDAGDDDRAKVFIRGTMVMKGSIGGSL